jgi:NADH-quinone oxidoreductase subunit M
VVRWVQSGYIYHYAFAMLIGIVGAHDLLRELAHGQRVAEEVSGTRKMHMGLLSLAIWTPIVFGAILLALGRDDQARTVRWIALIGSIVSFLVTLPLYGRFDLSTPAMQFVEKAPWIERFNVNYHLGVDGISLWFVLLTAFITVVVVISAWEAITERVNQYMGAFLILSGLMIGVFCALDGVLFYVFFEATLIPMYLIIGIWGGPEQDLRGLQVLPVHAARLAADAGGAGVPVHEGGRQLRHPHLAQAAADRAGADAAVLRLLRRLRGEGADVPGAHLAARRARGSAHRRLRRAGRHHAEAGRLRLPALLHADRADASREWAWLIIALSLIAVIYVGLVAWCSRT